MNGFTVELLKLLNAAKDEALKKGLWSGSFHASCRVFVEGAVRNPDNRDEEANVKDQPHHVNCVFSKSKTIVRMGYSIESGTWLIDSGNCRHLSLEKAISKGKLNEKFDAHPFLVTFLLHDTDLERNREMGYEGGAGVSWSNPAIMKFAKEMSSNSLGEEASEAMGSFNIKGCFTKNEGKELESSISKYSFEFTTIFSEISKLLAEGVKIRKTTPKGATNKNHIALFQTGIIKGMKEFLTENKEAGKESVEILIRDLGKLRDTPHAEDIYDLMLTTRIQGTDRTTILTTGVKLVLNRMMKDKSKKES